MMNGFFMGEIIDSEHFRPFFNRNSSDVLHDRTCGAYLRPAALVMVNHR